MLNDPIPEQEIKMKITISFVKEITTKKSGYPDSCKTVEQILALEKRAVEDDPCLAMEDSEMSVLVERVS